MHIPKAYKLFIGEAMYQLMNKKVSLNINRCKFLPGLTSGTFCNMPPELSVAYWRELNKWFPTFVHEYSHFLQWRDNYYYWDLAEKNDIDFFAWLDDYPKNCKSQKKMARGRKERNLTMLLEQECDMIAVGLIDEFDLPMDKELYIQKANTYHVSYHAVFEEGHWFKSPSMYEDERIYTLAPTEFYSYKELVNYPNRKMLSLISKYYL